MTLATKTVGEGDLRAVFLHGLFGRGRNFTTAAKAIAETHTSTLVDLPNHGDSAWTDEFSYVDMADTVADTLRQGVAANGPVDLIGHSMGGKTAMVLALRHRTWYRLVVVDISPVASTTAGVRPSAGIAQETDLDALLSHGCGPACRTLPTRAPASSAEPALHRRRLCVAAQPRPPARVTAPDRRLPDLTGSIFDGPTLWVVVGVGYIWTRRSTRCASSSP